MLHKVRFIVCIWVVSALAAAWLLLGGTQTDIIPYRFYYVLTHSMEPTIGANSLVLVKTLQDTTQIEENDIITFWANRFGERIIIMHRFSHTERNEGGEVVYRTRAEGSKTVDIYETKRQDILGIYLFHIPYVGKLMLFFKSVFGLLWLCQMIVILLIRELVSAKWKEHDQDGVVSCP